MEPAPKDDPKVARVVAAAAAKGVAIAPVIFPADTRTAADAAAAIGCDVAQIVKSLVFDSSSGPVLLLVSGANRVDTALGARAAGVEELTKADAEAVKAATGFSIGATPPVGHATELPIVMDEDLLTHDEVWAAGGRPDSVFSISPGDLRRISGAEPHRIKA